MAKSTSELFRKAILVAMGATAVTMEKVNGVIDELVEKGEMSEQQAKTFRQEVKEKAITEKDNFEKRIMDSVRSSIEKVVTEMGVATKKDLESLEGRLNARILETVKMETANPHPAECACEDCITSETSM